MSDLTKSEPTSNETYLIGRVRELEEAIEAIRCNSEPNTLGQACDLPKETAPHTREQHLEVQIRWINGFARATLGHPVKP